MSEHRLEIEFSEQCAGAEGLNVGDCVGEPVVLDGTVRVGYAVVDRVSVGP